MNLENKLFHDIWKNVYMAAHRTIQDSTDHSLNIFVHGSISGPVDSSARESIRYKTTEKIKSYELCKKAGS